MSVRKCFTAPSRKERKRPRWGFKGFVPPDHLASFVFVYWTNGVPTVNPGFSTYFKVGKSGGIDLEFCGLECHRIADSPRFTELAGDARRKVVEAWNYPESAGISNAVRWDVGLGAGFTTSGWIAMPPYRRREITLPQRVRSGHQRAIPLVDFVEPAGDGTGGWSGVELRIFLEPLKSPAIKTRPGEVDRTTHIASGGISGTMEETLRTIKNLPMDP